MTVASLRSFRNSHQHERDQTSVGQEPPAQPQMVLLCCRLELSCYCPKICLPGRCHRSLGSFRDFSLATSHGNAIGWGLGHRVLGQDDTCSCGMGQVQHIPLPAAARSIPAQSRCARRSRDDSHRCGCSCKTQSSTLQVGISLPLSHQRCMDSRRPLSPDKAQTSPQPFPGARQSSQGFPLRETKT